MNTIYKPSGKAGQYAEYALNIYSGCSHNCTYCWARQMHERWHGNGSFDKPVYRAGLLEALDKELVKGVHAGKLIHLCFSCDPYPAGIDTTPTREVIKLLKQAGCHIQILTKGGSRAERDFDLLDGEDWFGVTITRMQIEGLEPNAAPYAERITSLYNAYHAGIKTWVSFEPVYNPWLVYETLKECDYIDLYRIGKLNYHTSDINWHDFGHECERLAKQYGRNIYIKDELRREMEASR